MRTLHSLGISLFIFTALMLSSTFLSADHHGWQVVEAFSNEDGTLQFIELQTNDNGHNGVNCCALVTGVSATGVDTSYNFDRRLPGSQTGDSLLLATLGFESTFGITADFIIPDGFLTTAAGDVFYNTTLTWPELPVDVESSYNVGNIVAAATPRNLAGDTVTVIAPDVSAPTFSNLPASALTILSNVAVAGNDARVAAYIEPVSCMDDADPTPNLVIDLPASFSAGTSTSVNLTCTDSSDNSFDAAVVVIIEQFVEVDETAPVISGVPTEALVVFSNDSVPADDSRVTEYLAGVSCTDETDDSAELMFELPQLFGAGTNNNIAVFCQDSSGNNASASVGINIVEFNVADTVPPEISLGSPLTIAATGRLTVVDFGTVIATDNEDGNVEVTVDREGPFVSGSHTVQWRAIDSAGNEALASQVINIQPLLFLQSGQTTAEGNTVSFNARLSGAAPSYPVTVELAFSGTADSSDYTGLENQFSITAGDSLDIEIRVVEDDLDEGEEELEISIVSAIGAVVSESRMHLLTIAEENLVPRGSISLLQDGEKRNQIAQQAGTVTVSANATDPNLDDVLSFDWSNTAAHIVVADTSAATTSFDPSSLAPGTYSLFVSVSDDATPAGEILIEQPFIVVAQLATLTAAEDSDADGVSDLAEGLGDEDGDGIPDYLDALNDSTALPVGETDGVVIRAETGVTISLGDASLAADKQNASISDADVMLLSSNSIDRGFDHPMGLFDFRLNALPVVGQAATITIPLETAIPANATYRKFSLASGWQNFVVVGENSIRSFPGEAGICPPPKSSLYTDGLTEGSFCLELTLVDGGPNDADGIANGTIKDPGGIAIPNDDDVTPPQLSLPSDLSVTTANNLSPADSRVSGFLSAATCTDDVTANPTLSNDAPGSFALGTTTTVTFSCNDDALNEVTGSANVTVIEQQTVEAVNETSDAGAGCFIATAAYGSYLEPEVMVLRRFRDDVLLPHAAGEALVAFYYAYSPPIAEVIANSNALKLTMRSILTPLIYALKFPLPAVLALFVILAWRLRQRRYRHL